MFVIKCTLKSCTYEIPDVDASVAASLLIIHTNVNIASSLKPKTPKMVRPRIGIHWNRDMELVSAKINNI